MARLYKIISRRWKLCRPLKSPTFRGQDPRYPEAIWDSNADNVNGAIVSVRQTVASLTAPWNAGAGQLKLNVSTFDPVCCVLESWMRVRSRQCVSIWIEEEGLVIQGKRLSAIHSVPPPVECGIAEVNLHRRRLMHCSPGTGTKCMNGEAVNRRWIRR